MTHESINETPRARGIAAHVTVVTVWGSRRIMGRSGQRRNLCGAEPTLNDQPIKDARRMKAAERAEWITCARCLELLEAAS